MGRPVCLPFIVRGFCFFDRRAEEQNIFFAMGEYVACVTMRQRIAWIYGNGKTSSHLDIYPRNSNWKSMISVPLPMQKVVKNSWCGVSLVGLVLKSYVTNGTLVYVLLSKKINLFMGGYIGLPKEPIKNSREGFSRELVIYLRSLLVSG